MAIGNVGLMHECCPKHMGIGQQEWNKTTKQKEKVRREEWIYGKKYSEHEKKRSQDGLTIILAYTVPQGRYSLKQWMNYLTNLTYSYNPSTTPLRGNNKWIMDLFLPTMLEYQYSLTKFNTKFNTTQTRYLYVCVYPRINCQGC